MRIRVISAPIGWWTEGRIGEEFEVIETDYDYIEEDWEEVYEVIDTVINDGPKYVPKKDCVIVSEDESKGDAVNHPNHYQNGRFETIEMIEEITKGYADGFVAYSVGNALKYLSRAPFKHGEPTEDIRKAAKYLEFAIEYLTKEGE